MSMGWDRWDRRRRSVINAIANRYGVLLDPDLLEELLETDDPVEAVGMMLEHLPQHPLVLTLDDLKVLS